MVVGVAEELGERERLSLVVGEVVEQGHEFDAAGVVDVAAAGEFTALRLGGPLDCVGADAACDGQQPTLRGQSAR